MSTDGYKNSPNRAQKYAQKGTKVFQNRYKNVPDVVVLEPKRLRQQAIEELKQGLRGYE